MAAGGAARPVVALVDAGTQDRAETAAVLSAAGHAVRAYDSAGALLADWTAGRPGCVVLEDRLPDMAGIELARTLRSRGDAVPLVFLAARADVHGAVAALRLGALDYLEKPLPAKRLLAVVADALQVDARARAERERRRRCEQRLAQLTTREREVMDRVIEGKLNKIIAAELSISVKTVEAHRARVMEKLGVASVAALVRFAIVVMPSLLQEFPGPG